MNPFERLAVRYGSDAVLLAHAVLAAHSGAEVYAALRFARRVFPFTPELIPYLDGAAFSQWNDAGRLSTSEWLDGAGVLDTMKGYADAFLGAREVTP